MSKKVFIAGASKGIGLSLAKNLSKNHDFVVYAGCRNPKSEKIKNLSDSLKNIIPMEIDVSSEESIKVKNSK
jgi:NAD(P)-dependent dehydrogenase (short-subunit alcohol dehydrogenase family)